MPIPRAIPVVVMLAFTLGSPSAASEHYCDGAGPVTTVPAGAATLYISIMSEPDSIWLWAYAESNGVGGLQRGGADSVFGLNDPCRDSAAPDHAIVGRPLPAL